MPLGYRSIFTIFGEQKQTEEIIMEQFNEWLKKDPVLKPRNLNRDLYEINTVTVFSAGSELIYFNSITQDGTRTLRARLIEKNVDDGEKWTSTITLNFPRRRPNETQVLYEVDAPSQLDIFGLRRPRWVGNPNLVKRILEVVDAKDGMDGTVELGRKPRILDESETEALFDNLCDPERNISIIVAGTRFGEVPQKKIELLGKLSADCVGTATTYVLTPQATATFNDLVGEDHAVWTSSIRAYVPDFDPALRVNARIHPIIKSSSLDPIGLKKAARLLGEITRRPLYEKPLRLAKREFSRVEKTLNDREYEILLSGRKIWEIRPQAMIRQVVANALPDEVSNYLNTFNLIRSGLGIAEFTPELIKEIADKLAFADLISERLDGANRAIQELEFERDLAREERDDSNFQHSVIFDEYRHLEDRVKYLQRELAQSNRAQNAWLEVPRDQLAFYPESFESLFENLNLLPDIQFTGDKRLALSFDSTDLGGRAGGTWKELCGLNDYCRAKKEGKVNGGLMEYVDDTPNEYRTVTKNNYRGRESASVEQNAKLRDQRLLPVPESVERSGKVHMFSHITIGKRLHIHFYDDVARTGKIYVGRIGNHLDTVSTN